MIQPLFDVPWKHGGRRQQARLLGSACSDAQDGRLYPAVGEVDGRQGPVAGVGEAEGQRRAGFHARPDGKVHAAVRLLEFEKAPADGDGVVGERRIGPVDVELQDRPAGLGGERNRSSLLPVHEVRLMNTAQAERGGAD